MKQAIYPGSFDPITLGHLDIIRRAAGIFDRLAVAVMVNSAKRGLFSVEERVEMIGEVTADLPNVEVVWSDQLLAEFARQRGAGIVIKGLRALSDFESEFQMAIINKHLNPALDTMFLTAKGEYMYLSSSVVREVASYGGDISGFVPPQILDRVVRQAAAHLK